LFAGIRDIVANGQHSNLSTIGFAIGFVLMMVLLA
jgi:tetrahydromethanopterin S-methyltransferase subunit F